MRTADTDTKAASGNHGPRRGAPGYLLVLMLAAVTWACDPKTAALEPERPPWLDRVDVEVLGYREAFEKNTEILIRLHNKVSSPVVIDDLADIPGKFELHHAGGGKAPLHALSVGVAKPIPVGPKEVKATSLLFRATSGTPERLLLWDRFVTVPGVAP